MHHAAAAGSGGHLPPGVLAGLAGLAVVFFVLTIVPGQGRFLGRIAFDGRTGLRRLGRLAACAVAGAAIAAAAVTVNNHLHHARVVATAAAAGRPTREFLVWNFGGLTLAVTAGLFIVASLVALARGPRTRHATPRRTRGGTPSNARYRPAPARSGGRRTRW